MRAVASRGGVAVQPGALAVTGPAPAPLRVLVLGSGFRGGSRSVAALRRAGHDVVCGVMPGGPHQRSRHTVAPVRVPPTRTAEWVEAYCRTHDVDVVLPTTEDLTRALALAGEGLTVTVAGPDAAQYAALCDKAGLGATCARADVGHPRTYVDGAVPPGESLPLPAIVKTSGSGEDGDADFPVLLATTARDRDTRLAAMAAAGVGAVVQEVITGPAWVLHGVRDRDGHCPLAAALAVTTWPRDAGVSSVTRVMPGADALARTATPLLDAVDYVGPWCINGFERDGRLVVHDVNLRVAASVQAAIAAGLDVPVLGVAAAVGQTVAEDVPLRPVTYASLDGELRAAFAALRARDWREAARIGARAGAPATLRDPEPWDPWYVIATGRTALRRATRRVARRRH